MRLASDPGEPGRRDSQRSWCEGRLRALGVRHWALRAHGGWALGRLLGNAEHVARRGWGSVSNDRLVRRGVLATPALASDLVSGAELRGSGATYPGRHRQLSTAT